MKNNITVIIPTYNREKYLKELLDSIKDKKNIEIIVIDDASTDNTKELLKKYNQNNITIITNKKNKGIAYSRNVGIKNIKTKYFTFIDSDDNIDNQMLETMYNESEKHNLDICCCNYYEIINNKKVKSKYKYNNSIYNSKEIIERTLIDEVSTVVWGKLYKTSTFKNILFNEKLVINEDYEYVIRCFKNIKRIKLINEYLYNYLKNTTSITNNTKCIDIKNNYYLDNLDIKEYDNYNYFININELRKIHMYSKCIDKNNRYKYLKKEIDKLRLKRLLKTNISKFNKIEIIIFLINIRLYLFIYPLCIIIKNKIRS